MKNIFYYLLYSSLFMSSQALAQTKPIAPAYGHTLNLGVGVGGYAGYYSYMNHTSPLLHLDYEFDVAKSFTIAPFINVNTYSRTYYWGNSHTPYRNYTYRQTIMPIGIKGSYYLDNALRAGPKWDFYIAGSVGFVVVRAKWDADYGGDKNYYQSPSYLFLDAHVGTEYHINNKIGLFLDLSTGASTLGLAIH